MSLHFPIADPDLTSFLTNAVNYYEDLNRVNRWGQIFSIWPYNWEAQSVLKDRGEWTANRNIPQCLSIVQLGKQALNFLESKLTFLSNFMETLLIYVRHVVIWGFFLILDHRFKEWIVKLKARISRSRRLSEPPYCMHDIAIGIYYSRCLVLLI